MRRLLSASRLQKPIIYMLLFAFPLARTVSVDSKAHSLPWYSGRNHYKLGWQISGKALEKICESTELMPSGLGEGSLDCLYSIELYFHIRGVRTESELRKLLVKAMEIYLDEINNSEEVRPFMQSFPYQPENVDIRIFVDHYDGRTAYEPEIGLISVLKGTVYYKTYPKGSDDAEIIKTEPYEKVKDIVLAERFGYTGPLHCDSPSTIEAPDQPPPEIH